MLLQSFDSVLDECLPPLQRGESVEPASTAIRVTPTACGRCLRWPTRSARRRSRRPGRGRRRPPGNASASAPTDLRATEPRPVRVNVTYGAWLRPIAITAAVLAALFGRYRRDRARRAEQPAGQPALSREARHRRGPPPPRLRRLAQGRDPHRAVRRAHGRDPDDDPAGRSDPRQRSLRPAQPQ